MKSFFLYVSAFAVCVSLTACGDKKSDGADNADSTSVAANNNKPYADPSQTNNSTATIGGNTYSITIKRSADPSLPVVTDELGKQFYDNRVDVTITRNGEAFFEHSYTKEAFNDFLSSSERHGSVLLGMAYDSSKNDAHTIRLGAQVGQTGLGEGPAFCVEIPLNGGASSIVRDNNQDTTGDDGMTD